MNRPIELLKDHFVKWVFLGVPKFGAFLIYRFSIGRFWSDYQSEKKPNTCFTKRSFFYAWTPTLTLQAVGGKACPNGYKGERNSHHGGARYQNRGANDLPFKTTGIHRGVDASCVSNGSIRRLRPTGLGRCYPSQRLRLGGGGAFSKPPPSSIRQ